MSAPLTPPNCDLADFDRMMIDIKRLRGSKFDATLDDAVWRAGVNLWLSAWNAIPAGSLDDDDGLLAAAAGLGRDVRTWRKVRAGAMHGWVQCDDSRWYHPTVAEIALESWIIKLGQRKSSGAGNAAKYGAKFDPAEVDADIELAAAFLERLNPNSKALAKARRKHGERTPVGSPIGVPDEPPDGKLKHPNRDSHRESENQGSNLPSGSQETGTETGKEEKTITSTQRADTERVFAELWRLWPTEARKRHPQAKVRSAVIAQLKAGADPNALIAAGQAHVAERSRRGPEFVKGLAPWLSSGLWRNWAPERADDGPIDWTLRHGVWRDSNGEDWPERWGPPPGHPGHQGPSLEADTDLFDGARRAAP